MSEIEQLKQEEKKHVSWTVFTWAMAIIFIIFGFIFTQVTSALSQVADISNNNNDIKVQLSQIQTDLNWIKVQIVKK